MNYLLDTHVFLWMLADPARLSEKARKIIQNPYKSVYVSAVTAVEIAIKKKLGKLDAPDGLVTEIRSRGLLELPLRYTHGEAMQNTTPIPPTACSSRKPSARGSRSSPMTESLRIIPWQFCGHR